MSVYVVGHKPFTEIAPGGGTILSGLVKLIHHGTLSSVMTTERIFPVRIHITAN